MRKIFFFFLAKLISCAYRRYFNSLKSSNLSNIDEETERSSSSPATSLPPNVRSGSMPSTPTPVTQKLGPRPFTPFSSNTERPTQHAPQWSSVKPPAATATVRPPHSTTSAIPLGWTPTAPKTTISSAQTPLHASTTTASASFHSARSRFESQPSTSAGRPPLTSSNLRKYTNSDHRSMRSGASTPDSTVSSVNTEELLEKAKASLKRRESVTSRAIQRAPTPFQSDRKEPQQQSPFLQAYEKRLASARQEKVAETRKFYENKSTTSSSTKESATRKFAEKRPPFTSTAKRTPSKEVPSSKHVPSSTTTPFTARSSFFGPSSSSWQSKSLKNTGTANESKYFPPSSKSSAPSIENLLDKVKLLRPKTPESEISDGEWSVEDPVESARKHFKKSTTTTSSIKTPISSTVPLKSYVPPPIPPPLPQFQKSGVYPHKTSHLILPKPSTHSYRKESGVFSAREFSPSKKLSKRPEVKFSFEKVQLSPPKDLYCPPDHQIVPTNYNILLRQRSVEHKFYIQRTRKVELYVPEERPSQQWKIQPTKYAFKTDKSAQTDVDFSFFINLEEEKEREKGFRRTSQRPVQTSTSQKFSVYTPSITRQVSISSTSQRRSFYEAERPLTTPTRSTYSSAPSKPPQSLAQTRPSTVTQTRTSTFTPIKLDTSSRTRTTSPKKPTPDPKDRPFIRERALTDPFHFLPKQTDGVSSTQRERMTTESSTSDGRRPFSTSISSRATRYPQPFEETKEKPKVSTSAAEEDELFQQTRSRLESRRRTRYSSSSPFQDVEEPHRSRSPQIISRRTTSMTGHTEGSLPPYSKPHTLRRSPTLRERKTKTCDGPVPEIDSEFDETPSHHGSESSVHLVRQVRNLVDSYHQETDDFLKHRRIRQDFERRGAFATPYSSNYRHFSPVQFEEPERDRPGSPIESLESSDFQKLRSLRENMARIVEENRRRDFELSRREDFSPLPCTSPSETRFSSPLSTPRRSRRHSLPNIHTPSNQVVPFYSSPPKPMPRTKFSQQLEQTSPRQLRRTRSFHNLGETLPSAQIVEESQERTSQNRSEFWFWNEKKPLRESSGQERPKRLPIPKRVATTLTPPPLPSPRTQRKNEEAQLRAQYFYRKMQENWKEVTPATPENPLPPWTHPSMIHLGSSVYSQAGEHQPSTTPILPQSCQKEGKKVVMRRFLSDQSSQEQQNPVENEECQNNGNAAESLSNESEDDWV